MIRFILRDMLTRRLRLAMTALAIALGVAFMSGSLAFSSTLASSLTSLFATASNGTDVIVQHSSTSPGAVGGASARPVPASVLTAVRTVPGVAAADGQASGTAVLLGKDGKALKASFGVALSWPADPAFQSAFTGRTGSPPASPSQVVIDKASALAGGYRVGDQVGVSIAGRAMTFTVSGITGYGSGSSIAGGSMAIFTVDEVQRLFGKTGEYDQILVKAAPGVSPATLRDRVAAVLPAGVTAVTAASAAANEAAQLNSQLSILTDFFLGFAAIALFTGAFVIWNTFSIMVGQRTRSLALLRTLGAGRGQVFGSVLTEALLVGVVGSGLGVALGLGLARGLAALLSSFGVSLPLTTLSLPWQRAAHLAGCRDRGDACRVARARRKGDPGAARRGAAVGRPRSDGIAEHAPTRGGCRVPRRRADAALLAEPGPRLLVGEPARWPCFIGVRVTLAPMTVEPIARRDRLGGAAMRLPGRAGCPGGAALGAQPAPGRRHGGIPDDRPRRHHRHRSPGRLRACEVTAQINAASRTQFYVQATTSGTGSPRPSPRSSRGARRPGGDRGAADRRDRRRQPRTATWTASTRRRSARTPTWA